MIISHSRKYIFARPYKTAGSSLETYLLENHFDKKVDACKVFKGKGLHVHCTLREAKLLIDPKIWNSYHKIVIERNPWDRIISWFYWTTWQNSKDKVYKEMMDNDPDYTLPIFKRWCIDKLTKIKDNKIDLDKDPISFRNVNPICFDFHCGPKGEILADSFIKFENLRDDFNSFLNIFGEDLREEKFGKQKQKGNIRPRWTKNYKLLYDDELNKLVDITCKGQIKCFGYKCKEGVL